MAITGDHLLVVGPPDVVDTVDPVATFQGRSGSLLNIYSKQDGRLVRSFDLDEFPTFDGLSIAKNRLYLTTQDGKVICFGG